jgi:hypothetical protein
MPRDEEKRETPNSVQQTPDRLPSGSPDEEKELAEACARFADLCQYFSQQNMDLPTQIVDEVRLVSKLAVGDRIVRMRRFNQDLMEYLNNAGPDPQVRQ